MPSGASRWLAFLLVGSLVLPSSARAHNEAVHQRMTDYAYHVLLAGARFSQRGPMSERLRVALRRLETSNPGLTLFFADAAVAVPKLRAMPSGLPNDPAPCVTPFLVNLFGGPLPDWQLTSGASLDSLPMGRVRLPVGIHYGYGVPICAIDETYVPSGELASLDSTDIFTRRDHTGVTLGYWAAAPDKETKDWVLRSTTLEVLQNPAVVTGIGASVSVAVSAVCVLACGLFPPACAACPFIAVGAGGIVIDEITSIDADSLESEDYVGFGHFIDMKPTPASPSFFDAKPGKFMERAGPGGIPDTTEDLVTLLFDLGGIHVNHAEAQAPKNYQIVLGTSGAVGDDFHRNSKVRTPSQWESPTIPHLQLTAVDNLAMFGYEEAKANKGTPLEAKRLGWPLHAIGDASVPMHAVGASGYGHRPYEDAVDMVYDTLVGSGSTAASVNAISQVMLRALKWRKFIQDRRALRGTTEVPVRDLVTAVAATTRQKASAQPSVFKAASSLGYILDEDGAIATYDNPAMAAIQRDLLLEGIAAELAFLLSVTEVTP
jgi:hypothetical protein